MAKLTLPKSSTNVSTYIFIQDTSSTTGEGLTGLTHTSASLVAYYARPRSSACPITLASQTATGSFVSGGFAEVSGSMPGLYRFDLPNEVCATSADNTIVMLYGAANMLPVLLEIQLTTFDLNTTAVLSSASTIVDLVWDEPLTAATHNVTTSAGRRLRQLASAVIFDGLITGATTNTISFDGDASDQNGAYDPSVITVTSGCGIGQCRLIYQYAGTTKTATVDRDWKILPEAGDSCIIVADAGREHVNEGLCRSGSSLAVQLNALASDFDDAYIGQVIFIRSGTGADQARRIFGYDGTTKIATLVKPWDVIPDNTSAYVMLPTAVLDIERLINMIWDEELAGHTGSATAGSALTVSTASAVWNYSGRTLTSLGAALAEIPSAVWNYIRRSLTPPTEYTTEYAAEHEILCMRGDTLTYVFENIPVEAGYKNVYMTVKAQYKDLDSEALLQISSASGLVYSNGVASTSGSGATVTVDVSAQTVTIQVEPYVTQGFEYLSNGYVYDLQIIDASDDIETPVSGAFTLIRDVTRAIV